MTTTCQKRRMSSALYLPALMKRVTGSRVDFQEYQAEYLKLFACQKNNFPV